MEENLVEFILNSIKHLHRNIYIYKHLFLRHNFVSIYYPPLKLADYALNTYVSIWEAITSDDFDFCCRQNFGILV